MFDFSALSLSSGRCEVLVDVGANLGQFLFPALEYFRPRRWIAIEMLPDLAQQLQEKTCQSAPGGLVLSCAVGQRAGTKRVLRSAHSEASSLLALHPKASEWYGMDLSQREDGVVEVRSLDEICVECGIHHIDVLKIDVQGYEREVILGASQIMRRTANVIIEVEFVPVYPGQALAGEIRERLGALGFTFQQYLSEYRDPAGELLHADALFHQMAPPLRYLHYYTAQLKRLHDRIFGGWALRRNVNR